jgi:hypothetical protein
MTRGHLTATLLVVGSLLGCGGDSSGPGTGGTTAKVTDPSGDTFGIGADTVDLTAMTITRDTGGITVVLDFLANAVAPANAASNALKGYLDLDVDQNASTGFPSVVESFTSSLTGMGVDYELDMFAVNVDSSVTVFDSLGNVTGTVKPLINGKRVTLRIPRSMLGGDDAFLNAAIIVGVPAEPTDVAPDSGHLHVGGTGNVAPYRPSMSAGPVPRPEVSRWNRGWKAKN